MTDKSQANDLAQSAPDTRMELINFVSSQRQQDINPDVREEILRRVSALAAQPPAAPVETNSVPVSSVSPIGFGDDGNRCQPGSLGSPEEEKPSTPSRSSTETEQEPYSFGTDYGKDLLTDINQAIHRGGTNAVVQDCLKRCYREITRLRGTALPQGARDDSWVLDTAKELADVLIAKYSKGDIWRNFRAQQIVIALEQFRFVTPTLSRPK